MTGWALPAEDTLLVTSHLDQPLNLVWFSLVLAAGEGRFGPFTVADLMRERFIASQTPPLQPARVRAALKKLTALDLVTAN